MVGLTLPRARAILAPIASAPAPRRAPLPRLAPLRRPGVPATPLPILLARWWGDRFAWAAWRAQYARVELRRAGAHVPFAPGPRARLTLNR